MDLIKEAPRLKSVGIVGGTFNPVHNGHIIMGEYAMEILPDLDKVVYMPNNMPAYKDNGSIVAPEDRINMLKLAIRNPRMAVSDMEIKRGGITYTIDTLRILKKINNNLDIYLIIGADSLISFDKWKEYVNILKLSKLVVARRDDSDDKLVYCSDKLKEKVSEASIIYMNSPKVYISSSKLRNQFARGEYDSEFVSKYVLEYIKEHKLYM